VLAGDNANLDGSIASGDLNPQKSRVLLQLGLMLTADPAELQRFFDLY
jgi:L-asparaginase